MLAPSLAAALLLAPAAPAASAPAAARPEGAAVSPRAPEGIRALPREKCPVCGMFVAKFPDWAAEARFRDGSRAVFDGAKDLFRYWLDPARYLPGRSRDEIVALAVTDYYALAPVDARAASYVVGSDVLGPMGRELVPFSSREAAEEFRRDHRGTRVLAFDEVTPEVLRALDG